MCPCKKRKFEHKRDTRDVKDHVSSQQEGSQLQLKERVLKANQACPHFHLELQPQAL
jgi:hypothetical protein